jgi:hypothetical protein
MDGAASGNQETTRLRRIQKSPLLRGGLNLQTGDGASSIYRQLGTHTLIKDIPVNRWHPTKHGLYSSTPRTNITCCPFCETLKFEYFLNFPAKNIQKILNMQLSAHCARPQQCHVGGGGKPGVAQSNPDATHAHARPMPTHTHPHACEWRLHITFKCTDPLARAS